MRDRRCHYSKRLAAPGAPLARAAQKAAEKPRWMRVEPLSRYESLHHREREGPSPGGATVHSGEFSGTGKRGKQNDGPPRSGWDPPLCVCVSLGAAQTTLGTQWGTTNGTSVGAQRTRALRTTEATRGLAPPLNPHSPYLTEYKAMLGGFGGGHLPRAKPPARRSPCTAKCICVRDAALRRPRLFP